MNQTTYNVKVYRTREDARRGNVEVFDTGYSKEEAEIAAEQYKDAFHFYDAWSTPETEEEPPSSSSLKGAAITRSIESDRSGQKYTVVRCGGWAI